MADLPRVGNAVQNSEMMRNSLGVNYKSAALNQLSYAGKNAAHINARCHLKQVADRFVVVVWESKNGTISCVKRY